jgi:hypothetical protein
MEKLATMMSRRFRMAENLSDEQLDDLSELLSGSNVSKFIVNHQRLSMKYDVTVIQWPEIFELIKDYGEINRVFCLNRVRNRWYRYVDQNALANATSKSDHCCNKPPVIPKQ